MSGTADPFPRTDSATVDRLNEVAGIIALGILRLRARRDSINARDSEDSCHFGVDFDGGQSVCGSEPEKNGECI